MVDVVKPPTVSRAGTQNTGTQSIGAKGPSTPVQQGGSARQTTARTQPPPTNAVDVASLQRGGTQPPVTSTLGWMSQMVSSVLSFFHNSKRSQGQNIQDDEDLEKRKQTEIATQEIKFVVEGSGSAGLGPGQK